MRRRDRAAELVQASSVSGLPGVTSLAVIGSVAFVGHGTAVTAVDLSDPAQPALVEGLSLPGLCRSVTVRDWS
jgi:hypothetical protein